MAGCLESSDARNVSTHGAVATLGLTWARSVGTARLWSIPTISGPSTGLYTSIVLVAPKSRFLRHGSLFALCDIRDPPDLTQMMITMTVAGLIVLTFVRSARNWGVTAVGSTNY